jgi:hypothetical protein
VNPARNGFPRFGDLRGGCRAFIRVSNQTSQPSTPSCDKFFPRAELATGLITVVTAETERGLFNRSAGLNLLPEVFPQRNYVAARLTFV